MITRFDKPLLFGNDWWLFRQLSSRFLQTLFTFWLVTILFFSVTELLPGDFASATATREMTREMIESTRYRLGLYTPAVDRYLEWMSGILTGDLGTSWWMNKPNLEIISERAKHSLWLVAWAAILTIPTGLALAVVAVRWHGKLVDRTSSSIALVITSIPDFVIAYFLMAVFAVHFNLFPVHTIYTYEMTVLERLEATMLPILSVAAITITPIFRLSRAALLNIMSAEYIGMAELKGISRWRIILWHAMPNAAGAISNAIVVATTNLFFGLVIVESIFSYPGYGDLLINAVKLRDVPLVQACALVAAIIYIGMNAMADGINFLTTPRLWYSDFAIRKSKQTGKYSWFGLLSISRPVMVMMAIVFLFAVVFLITRNIPNINFREVAQIETPSGDERTELTTEELLGQYPDLQDIVHYDFFRPFGETAPARHKFEGRLEVPEFTGKRRRVGDVTAIIKTKLPGFFMNFITSGDVLLPIERDRLILSKGGGWYIIISPGRIWYEPDDGDWSRGSFPFSLTQTSSSATYYGVASFLFNGKSASQLRVQVAQETANWAQFDIWGQTPVRFTAGAIADADKIRDAYKLKEATRLNVRPWEDLASRYWSSLEIFDGEDNRQNIATSGLMVDDIYYSRGCHTRAGPHPYCRNMRYGVFSITKTMGASVAMLWLAKKYGPQVFDEKLTDHISIPASHDGWSEVTFGHALDMMTGIGNLTPYRLDEYVEVDFSSVANDVWRAGSMQDKLDAMAGFRSYPWGPGEVFRYRTTDTTALSAAMQSYIKRMNNPDADLWDMLVEEVFLPLGIDRLPVRRTMEPNGKRGTALLGAGLYLTIEEAIKIARLFQDHGEHDGRQLLHRELTAKAVSSEFGRGFPNGWQTESGESRYEMGFWLTPYKEWLGCRLQIPGMAGFGGNYVMVMPNRTIGLRFADGHDDNPHTWNSYGIRTIANKVRPFCR